MSSEPNDLVKQLRDFIAKPSTHPDCIDADGKTNIWRYINTYHPSYMLGQTANLTHLDFGNLYWDNVRTYEPSNYLSATSFGFSQFYDSYFVNADLRFTHFNQAILTNFQVINSTLRSCQFQMANFFGKICWENSRLSHVDAYASSLEFAPVGTQDIRTMSWSGCTFNNASFEQLQAGTGFNDIATTITLEDCAGDISFADAIFYELHTYGGETQAEAELTLDLRGIDLEHLFSKTKSKPIDHLTLLLDEAKIERLFLNGQAQLSLFADQAVADWCEMSITKASDLCCDGFTVYDTLSIRGPVQHLSAQQAQTYHLRVESPEDIASINLTGLQTTNDELVSDSILIHCQAKIGELILDETDNRHSTDIRANTIDRLSLKNSQLEQINCTSQRVGTMLISGNIHTALSFQQPLEERPVLSPKIKTQMDKSFSQIGLFSHNNAMPTLAQNQTAPEAETETTGLTEQTQSKAP